MKQFLKRSLQMLKISNYLEIIAKSRLVADMCAFSNLNP